MSVHEQQRLSRIRDTAARHDVAVDRRALVDDDAWTGAWAFSQGQ